jgi:5-formyltetrahydrofolate cyclo-ligase
MIKPGARIGVYLALPDELSLQPFIELAWQRGCHLFVPHITHARCGQMAFYPLRVDSRLQAHRWGMPQLLNTGRQIWRSDRLDVVLVPLLGFDAQGNRLGMGGGFYDRHFARLARVRRRHRPHLIGVAYACQEVARLNSQPHDVRLEQIVTERGIVRAQMR